jgi:methanogenic corrinoid protein MtbC1
MAGLRQRAIDGDGWEAGEGIYADQGALARLQPIERCDGLDASMSQLVRTIEGEIIPRLMLAHRVAPGVAPASGAVARAIVADDIPVLARLLLAQDVSAVSAFVDGVRGRGVDLETLYLELLAPAARYLGQLWEADLCDFAEVTFGLWRLQQVVRNLSPVFQHEAPHREPARRALLLPAPGEQHSFGLFMVAEFFRRAGWDVWAGPAVSTEEIVALVRREAFAVIGLSVSCETRLEGLATCIHALRRASRNRGVGIMVGGRVIAERPERVALVGADATALDGRQACLQAEGLLRLLPGGA